MLPSLFIAHGSPMLAIENNEYTQFLRNLGKSMTRPKGIVCFTAHWESEVQKVSEVEDYSMIYDFGGFPDALYRIQYPARGDRDLAKEIARLLAQQAVPHEAESRRGLDHGAWVVLRLLYPDADIPVVAMSVNQHISTKEQYDIGRALSTLRAQNILVIGSGGTVHNLRAIGSDDASNEWAVQFDDWLAERLSQWDVDSLYDYESQAPHARLAVPPYGKEHFIPLFYAMGAADDQRTATLLHRSYRYGSLSHSVWLFG